MADNRKRKIEQKRENFIRRVGRKEERKLQARRQPKNSLWYGLGMMGMVAWSVVIPTILGVVIGLWLDHHYKIKVSFTLILLVLGLAVGCLNAWHWVMKEGEKLRKKDEAN